MNTYCKIGALLIGMGAALSPARADRSETRGGVTIRSEDGRFEARFGGRIHLDSNIFITDDDEVDGIGDQTTDIYFRRTRLTLTGKAYGWRYMLENDFAGQDDGQGSGFREVWIATDVFGANLRVGQAKPFRGMEELTSSNELHFIERPFSSSNSLYGNRQYTTGLFLNNAAANWGWGVSGYNLRSGADSDDETDGVGATARVYWAPVLGPQGVFHLGVTSSIDNPANGLTVAPSSARYAGRSGPGASLSAVASSQDQTTFGLELAGRVGPFYAQGEYASARFAQDSGGDLDVDTYYVQATYLITGEIKPYDIDKGVFKSVKPKRPIGAWEAKLRYDAIETDGLDADREVSQFIVGLNWFVNPSVRMMFEYIRGDDHLQGSPERSGDLIATRLQFAF
ncbi:OprO/OprP family phosphate-selective porin [Panacagrimonas sp.]|uniref:OprO/OprP family phosphate-selective porin n=1 Tax=Panacagrimonas sp. TaxID=2480088 RepID=UPI003B52C772